ncbi:energy-coupling factor transporter transmembrane component T family protein [Desulfitobacterium sp. Sab5]|uniref:energy-coupling factor transporter transmembrane component T family protein n=1 Tax=Desulfitobacterium nosdiversum TaxID=3375356 RepID=UPI003CEDBD7D
MNLEVYYPGKSQLHRLDARLKVAGLIWLSLWITWSPWQSLMTNTIGLCLLVFLSHLPIRLFRSSLYAFIGLSLFYILTSAWTWNSNGAYWQGFWSWSGIGATGLLLWRIGLIFLLTRLFVGITPPLEQGIGIAYFFNPVIKVFPRIADFVLILTLTLRFVPVLLEEAELLGKARMLKGEWPRSRFQRVWEISRLIPPLLLTSLRRADEVAENLLARGYTAGTYRSISFAEWTQADQRGVYILLFWPLLLFLNYL